MYNTVRFKLFITSLLLCFTAHYTYAQKTEFHVNAYSGLFFFRGNGSVSSTTISIVGPDDGPGLYNAYPFGRKSGASYALELQMQRVTRGNQLFGAGIGLESLQSKAAIDSVRTGMGIRPTTGKILLTNTFITINPYIGQRFVVGGVMLDAQAGIDVAASIKVYEEAKLELEKNYTYSNTHSNYPVDLRPRIQINAYYKRIGLLAGYSLGTENLYRDRGYDYLNRTTYANYLRLGISYKLK